MSAKKIPAGFYLAGMIYKKLTKGGCPIRA